MPADPRDPARRPPGTIRRDPDGSRSWAPDWEDHIERQIREAQQRGDFDDLPGRGRPLPRDGQVHRADLDSAHRILRNAGAAPPWIEADKEVRARREERDRLLEQAHRSRLPTRDWLRRRLREIAEAHDRAVQTVNALAPNERLHRTPMRLDDEMRRLEDAFDAADETDDRRPRRAG